MTPSAQFVRQAHAIVRDLLPERPRYYLADFMITMLVTYGTLAISLLAPAFSIVQLAALLVCSLAMYRAVVFTHEIAHRRSGAFVEFTWIWNLLCGVPFLVPSFLYGDHKGHHLNQAYGTWADPEYILRSRRWRMRVVVFLLLPLAYPLLACVRFLVLTPAALWSTRVDRYVWTYASSLFVMNESYRREYDARATATSRWVQELACSVWSWMAAGLVLAGRLPPAVLGQIYLIALLWLTINQVRTLVAHRYTNDPASAVSHIDQLLDTNTFPYGNWLPELWAPVGLRYHALHHLLPRLPYHAMHEAHSRLMSRLPADSPYHQTVRPGLWSALIDVVRDRDGQTRSPRSAVAATLREDRPGSR
jgi:fatty acid desaturase